MIREESDNQRHKISEKVGWWRWGWGQDCKAQTERLTLERRNATSFFGTEGRRKVWMCILVDL